MVTLAISCLTSSNLLCLMDLTFQVPIQHCSLQHQALLPSPDTSTTGGCFHFSSASSFFLQLFLHSSPVAYLAPTNLGSSSFSTYQPGEFIFQYPIFLPFYTIHAALKARILKCVAIPFSSGPCLLGLGYDWEKIMIQQFKIYGPSSPPMDLQDSLNDSFRKLLEFKISLFATFIFLGKNFLEQ